MSVLTIKDFEFRPLPRNAGMIKSKMDTILLTREAAMALELPPFQRPLRAPKKIAEIAEQMRINGGVIEGVMTLGILRAKRYLVDGQHRREAFLLSGLPEAYVDVRICEFETMGEMADEFVRLNTAIAKITPDDVLRGLEQSNVHLQAIRRECPFVGYGYLNANPSSPAVGMSALLRSWDSSKSETPSHQGGVAVHSIASDLTEEETREIITFLRLAHSAWGVGKEVSRLWGRMNLMLCMWLWQRIVKSKPANGRTAHLTQDQFRKALMSLSADPHFNDWLQGRWNERWRAPTYNRIKALFAERLKAELGHKVVLPAPEWSNP